MNGSRGNISQGSNTLTLTLSLTAASGFTGTKNVYLYVMDSEGSNSGWQNKETWTIPPPSTAAGVSGRGVDQVR